MVDAGASRIGASASVKIVTEAEPASKKPVTESAAGGAPAVAKSQY